jgi:hypothetical protein
MMKNHGAMKLPKAIRVCAPILQNKANATALTADKNNQSGSSEGKIHAAAAAVKVNRGSAGNVRGFVRDWCALRESNYLALRLGLNNASTFG